MSGPSPTGDKAETKAFSLNFKEQCEEIVANGNHPEEWRDYIEFLKKKINLLPEDRKKNLLNCVYTKAIKESESYKTITRAQLCIDYAYFKRPQNSKDAEKFLLNCRRILRHYSIVHVACADFELLNGNREKALKILYAAQSYGSSPPCYIEQAILKMNSGASRLDEVWPTKMSEVKDGNQSSPDSKDSGSEMSKELSQPMFPPKMNTQELQENLDQGLKLVSRPRHTRDGYRPSRELSHQACPPRPNTLNTQELQHEIDEAMESRVEQNLLKPPPPPVLLSDLGDETNAGQRKSGLTRTTSTPQLGNKYRKPTDLKSSQQQIPASKKILSFLSSDEKNNSSVKQEGSLSHKKNPSRRPVRVPRRVPAQAIEEQSPDKDSDFDTGSFPRFNMPARAATVDLAGFKTESVSSSNDVEMDTDDYQPPRSSIKEDKENDNKVKPVSRQNSEQEVEVLTPQVQNMEIDSPGIKNSMRKTNCNDHQIRNDATYTAKRPQPAIPQAIHTPVISQVAQENHPRNIPKNAVTPAVPQVVPTPIPQFTPMKVAPQIPAQTPQQKMRFVNGHGYMVIRLVGRGGSAKVYQVLDSNFAIRALKIVNLEGSNPTILEGYMNEIALLQKLSSCPRVIKLFDCEHDAARQKLFMVLEFGETDLADYLSKNVSSSDPLNATIVCSMWLQMVTAVNAMHKEGVIHSDLKPANFILVSGTVKLIDFGIANALQVDKTSVLKESLVGTPSYMSPEALICNNSQVEQPKYKVGVRSDVWSLGCILYQMTYGKTPFQHLRNKLQAIVDPSHRIKFPDVGIPALTDILQLCLTRDVNHRPTTSELLQHKYFLK